MTTSYPPGVVGPKDVATGRQAMVSSQNVAVTDLMLDVLRQGGNAVDAAIAGSMLQATVSQEMTNHAGTVTVLFYEAATGQVHELNSCGTIVPDLPPFRQVPVGRGFYAVPPGPFAVVPGFMPGVKELYSRFGTRPWASLVEPAAAAAREGHVVSSFEHYVAADMHPYFSFTPSGRRHFAPGGRVPQVGERWAKPELAVTLDRLAKEGPDDFLTGQWARDFVTRANEVGWHITLAHMTAVPPRWGEGTRFRHGEHEIVQLSPPQMQALFCGIVLGILRELDVAGMGHYAESAESAYYLAHALRRAKIDIGHVNDPRVFEDPTEVLLDPDYHRTLARLLRRSRPRTNLSGHIEVTSGPAHLLAPYTAPEYTDSCEISVVDPHGNWLQMMNTMSCSGIPGEVVGGVPMTGCQGTTSLNAAHNISGWFTGGGHVRSVIGNTLVLKDGAPVLALGTPGKVDATIPQVLSNILDFGMSPEQAEAAPLMMPLGDDYSLRVESRLPDDVVGGLHALGIRVDPLDAFNWHMGSFEMSWTDADGTLHGSSGRRREGKSAGF
ncbi:gamma-glutamyltransferase [Nonomuraea sp. MG754425]|uniref:gamma-glutamyltransferase n=1 Tax=Nonomuraea sp. MG754425 TaxID=2570319 RepID=UPI001F1621BF|nr:gamma-glutamyltransferase [Nonomuraea sp. MG754425]